MVLYWWYILVIYIMVIYWWYTYLMVIDWWYTYIVNNGDRMVIKCWYNDWFYTIFSCKIRYGHIIPNQLDRHCSLIVCFLCSIHEEYPDNQQQFFFVDYQRLITKWSRWFCYGKNGGFHGDTLGRCGRIGR